ncbi:MAG: leucyl/phenylalanyl-tRNA--protein transferase [Nitrospirae bacterium]|nr:leucyl/phenylalanyl-tRNA--protein transferase [Nitrospirota bacterium]NTW65506.1 leucyl/phenylalanyl-tRNA--protein transferase [Nitrospirota bacterium]
MPVYSIPQEMVFPDPELAEEDGLLGVGGDLKPERLLLAYSNGIFPWFSKGEPIMWWSPDPRCVLYPENLKVSTSLRQAIRKGGYEVRFDTCFTDVIRHCSSTKRKGQRGTWITKEMAQAYIRLHELGHAHSTEVFMDGTLAGGLYGVSVGLTYSGESMFHLRPEASKIALYHLVQQLKDWKFPLIDCQVTNPHLLSLGAEEMPRKEFLKQVKKNREKKGHLGKWE